MNNETSAMDCRRLETTSESAISPSSTLLQRLGWEWHTVQRARQAGLGSLLVHRRKRLSLCRGLQPQKKR